MTSIITSISEYKARYGFGNFTPKAVLFDMDGVIYDSMPHHAIAWTESMAEAGIQMSVSEAYEYEGMRGVETIGRLFEKQKGIKLDEKHAQKYYDRKSEIFASLGPARKMEGVEELMHLIHSDGLVIGVVTGSGQKSLLNRLEKDFPGLLHKELMVTSSDVKTGKPAPDPYLQGLKKCGVEPWEAIVVENAPLGVKAAVAARIFTVAVNTGPLPNSKLTEQGSSLIFNRMTDFRDHWHELMAAARQQPTTIEEK